MFSPLISPPVSRERFFLSWGPSPVCLTCSFACAWTSHRGQDRGVFCQARMGFSHHLWREGREAVRSSLSPPPPWPYRKELEPGLVPGKGYKGKEGCWSDRTGFTILTSGSKPQELTTAPVRCSSHVSMVVGGEGLCLTSSSPKLKDGASPQLQDCWAGAGRGRDVCGEFHASC